MAKRSKNKESPYPRIYYSYEEGEKSPYRAWYYIKKLEKDGTERSRPVFKRFKTERERGVWAKEVDSDRKELGQKSNVLNPARRKQWEHADAMLDPWEDPVDVVRQWRETHPRLGERPSKKRLGPTANQVIDAYYERHKNEAEFEANEFNSHMDRFRLKFGRKSVQWLCENKHEIANWIKGLDFRPATKKNQKSRVAVAFSEGVENGLIRENPFFHLKINFGKKPTKIEYLSVDDCIQLFVANFDRPGRCARLALGLIGGLRSSAVPRVEYCDFRFSINALEIPDWKAKKGKGSLIEDWPDAVWKWVHYASESDFAPPCEDLNNPFAVNDWKKKLGSKWKHEKSMACKRAGLTVHKSDKICKRGEAEAKCPPKNWARHSFGTYHSTAFNNLGLTSALMSHEVSVHMLKLHYMGVTTKAETKRFFEITPEFIASIIKKRAA